MTFEEMADCIRKGDNPLAILRIAVAESKEADFNEGLRAAERAVMEPWDDLGDRPLSPPAALCRAADRIRALRRPPAGQGKGR